MTFCLINNIGRERNLYLTIPAIHKRVKSILHCTPSVNSTLFFQAGSEIMKKYLQTGQCILVNLWSVVAFDDTCSIQLLNISQITYSFIGCQGIMLRIEGPGNVYFSSHGSGPRSSQELLPQLQSQRLIPSPLSICLNLAMYFLILFLVLMLLGHYFIDEEFLEELKRQLEQLERNNNQNNRNPLGGDNADEF